MEMYPDDGKYNWKWLFGRWNDKDCKATRNFACERKEELLESARIARVGYHDAVIEYDASLTRVAIQVFPSSRLHSVFHDEESGLVNIRGLNLGSKYEVHLRNVGTVKSKILILKTLED